MCRGFSIILKFIVFNDFVSFYKQEEGFYLDLPTPLYISLSHIVLLAFRTVVLLEVGKMIK